MPTGYGKYARQMGLAMEIPSLPVAGGVVGYYVDKYFQTGPIFLILFGIAGLAAAALNIVKIAREMNSKSDAGN